MLEQQYPEELKYSENHQWVRVVDNGSHVLVGVTTWVNKNLGDLLYIDLPELGIEVDSNEEIGLLESVTGKNYEFYSPISGKIIAVNNDLEDAPRFINSDPYGDGWIYKIKLLDEEEIEDLMTSDEYQDFLSNNAQDDDEDPFNQC
jgi:glycine cleavage system H protein